MWLMMATFAGGRRSAPGSVLETLAPLVAFQLVVFVARVLRVRPEAGRVARQAQLAVRRLFRRPAVHV